MHDGCGMGVFCKHFGMPKWGGMCCVYYMTCVWWGFISIKFSDFSGGVVIEISHVCVDFLEGERGVL